MSAIPAFLLVHSVTVRPLLGRSSTGDVYGPPVPLQCMVQGKRRMVRDNDGTEKLSSLTLWAAPGNADAIPPGSLVEWAGDTTTVIASTNQDGGGLPTPDHTEVVCE